MSLTTLPLEVLETLFLYVRLEDLLSVWEVVGIEGSDCFWKKVCRRQGYERIPGEDECWKSVFQRNINWLTGTFVKREYKFEKSKSNSQCTDIVLHGKNLLVKDDGAVLVWGLSETPEVIQTLSADYFNVGGTKLSTFCFSESKIYTKENCKYHKVMDLTTNLRNFTLDSIMSNDFLAEFEDNHRTIKVIDFPKDEHFSLTLSQKVMPVTLLLSGTVLNILLIEGNQYTLRRFHLRNKEWLEDIVLFRGAALISSPDLQISPHLIAGWCKIFGERGVTPLKIWNSNGELLQSLSIDFIISFGPKKELRDPEKILWMIVEGEHIILSTSTVSLTIWSLQNPDVCEELPKTKDFYEGQGTISSSFLVLSYSYGFKVVDFKKVTYLYEVQFNNEQCNSPLLRFFNEYFYVVLKEEHLVKNDLSQKNYSFIGGPSSSDENLQLQTVLKSSTDYSMFIYDFRGSQ